MNNADAKKAKQAEALLTRAQKLLDGLLTWGGLAGPAELNHITEAANSAEVGASRIRRALKA